MYLLSQQKCIIKIHIPLFFVLEKSFFLSSKQGMNSASLPNNNLDLNSWYTFYSRALFPNRYHLPYLHVLGCWEWQIDWENSHITTQWERECVMCSKQRNTTAMALTPSKCLLSTQPNHKESVRARMMEDNSRDNVKDFWWFVDSETRHGRGENGAL